MSCPDSSQSSSIPNPSNASARTEDPVVARVQSESGALLASDRLPAIEEEAQANPKVSAPICQIALALSQNLAEPNNRIKKNVPGIFEELREACIQAIETGYAECSSYSIIISHAENCLAIIDKYSQRYPYDHLYVEDNNSFVMVPYNLLSGHNLVAECFHIEPSGGGHVSRQSGIHLVCAKPGDDIHKYDAEFLVCGDSEYHGKGDHDRAGRKLARLLAQAPSHKGIVTVLHDGTPYWPE